MQKSPSPPPTLLHTTDLPWPRQALKSAWSTTKYSIQGPSWSACARLALSMAGTSRDFRYRAEPLQTDSVQQLATGGAARHELPLSWKCECTTKMALVPVRQPSEAEWRELDQQPWGATIVAETATLLGMPLASTEPWGVPYRAAHKAQTATAYAKPADKVAKRQQKFELARRSSKSGCAYWSSYISSCPSYISSYFVPTPESIASMNRTRASNHRHQGMA